MANDKEKLAQLQQQLDELTAKYAAVASEREQWKAAVETARGEVESMRKAAPRFEMPRSFKGMHLLDLLWLRDNVPAAIERHPAVQAINAMAADFARGLGREMELGIDHVRTPNIEAGDDEKSAVLLYVSRDGARDIARLDVPVEMVAKLAAEMTKPQAFTGTEGKALAEALAGIVRNGML